MRKDLPMTTAVTNERMQGDEEQTAFGLISVHNQMNVLAQEIFAAAAETRALTTLLFERGVLTEHEYNDRREAEERRLALHFGERKIGERLSLEPLDKYALSPDDLPKVDCANRYHLCKGACCAMNFPLSRQDLSEGVVRWEYSQPYMIRHAADNRCVHQDRQTHQCSIYEQRPGVCRTYTCEHDKRIWLDFEHYVINPDLIVEDPDGGCHVQFLTLPDGEGRPDGATRDVAADVASGAS